MLKIKKCRALSDLTVHARPNAETVMKVQLSNNSIPQAEHVLGGGV